MERIWGDQINHRTLYGYYMEMNIIKYLVKYKSQIWQKVFKDLSGNILYNKLKSAYSSNGKLAGLHVKI